MDKIKPEMDVERECEEVRRIFADINGKIDNGMAVSFEDMDYVFVRDGEEIPVEETRYVFVVDEGSRFISMKDPSVKSERQLTVGDVLKELEQNEYKKIKDGRDRTVYCMEDIAERLKGRVMSINEDIESFPYFEAKRRFSVGKEKRIYKTLIEELVKYEDLEFGAKEDREPERDCKEVRRIVEELGEKIGKKVVVKDEDGDVVTGPMGSKKFIVEDGLYGLLIDECLRIRHGNKRKWYCVKDIIEMARKKIEQWDGYLDTKDKMDAMKKDELGKVKGLYERVVDALKR